MVVALLLMGARDEPYLEAVLASLRGAVDFVVVNDNSGDVNSHNRRVLEESELYREGLVGVVEAPFVNFADARNRCLGYIRKHIQEKPWVLTVDCDDVHGPALAALTRTVLPQVSEGVAVVDGYFVQFMQTFDFFTSLDRKYNLIFRFDDEVFWESGVHEKLRRVEGTRLCLPYVYYHCGYVQSNQRIRDKWQQYQALGDSSFDPQALAEVDTSSMFAHQVPHCMPYSWGYPPALLAIRDQVAAIQDPSAARFAALVKTHLRQPWPRQLSVARRLNYRLRLLWRALQAPFIGTTLAVCPTLLRMAL